MVKQVGITKAGNIKDFQGLSTDPKPVSGGSFGTIGGMSSFYESDTGEGFIYDELNVNPTTTTKWWED